MELAKIIESLFQDPDGTGLEEVRAVFKKFRQELTSGRVRAAEPDTTSTTGWRTNSWVKQGILIGFRCGAVVNFPSPDMNSPYLDKDTLPLHPLSTASKVRLVPGGSSIRDGSYVGENVICMPPMYINIGAYVDEGSLIDSHALVGSCAQVGKRVHVSAAAQIGGVLEPVGALPVIVEDDVLLGGNTGIYEGAVIKKRAVIAAGTVLTGSTPIYDLPKQRIIKPAPGASIVVPEGAVVVPGARSVSVGSGSDWGLSLATPVIIKYRDDRTDTRTELEAWLR